MKYVEALLDNSPFVLFALGLAMAFGFVVSKGTGHLSADNKARLSLYLQGDYRGSWAENFCDLFDSIFGARHVSLKTFLRSALASVLAVGAVYVLLGPLLGTLEVYGSQTSAFFFVLTVAVFVNFIPDYVSLWQTRLVLNWFKRHKSLLTQIVLLSVDLGVSVLIIWVSINLYSIVRTGLPVSLVEMSATYSPYAVCFYSTFLTSVWAWLYCSTSWFVRGFVWAGLHRLLDVSDRAAGHTLAFVGGSFIFLGALLANQSLSLASPDAAAPPPRNAVGSEIEDLIIEACGQETCNAETLRLMGVPPEAAFQLWNNQCRDGSAKSCFAAGVLLKEAASNRQERSTAVALLRDGCNRGDARSCTALGLTNFQGDEEASQGADYARAASLFRQACDQGDRAGCFNLGVLYRDGLGVGQDYSIARSLFQRVCEDGGDDGCTNLGFLYENGFGVAQDNERAYLLFIEACRLGNNEACAKLETYQEVPKPGSD